MMSCCLNSVKLAALLAVVCALSGLSVALVDAKPPDADMTVAGHKFVAVTDKSGSMEDKMESIYGSLELAAAILDGRVQIISFADDASASPDFDLTTQRDDLCQWARSMSASGGTNFLAWLDQFPLDAAAGLVITDGGASEDPRQVLAKIAQNPDHPRLYTIGIQTSGNADQLLAQMAAATGGSYYRVDSGADAVKAFLAVLAEYRQFRTYEWRDKQSLTVELSGEFLVVAHGEPAEISAGTPQWRTAHLPDGDIHVARGRVARSQSVVIRPGARSSRVVLIRFDLSRAAMNLACVGKLPGKMLLRASTQFFDTTGNVIDPSQKSTLKSAFQMLDENGNVVHTVHAQPTGFENLEAMLEVPLPADGSPPIIRNWTAEEASKKRFTSKETRAVSVDDVPIEQLQADTQVQATCRELDMPMEIEVDITAKTNSPDALQSFLSGLESAPPTVKVTTPNGRTVSTESDPGLFRRMRDGASQAVFESRLEFHGVTEPGEYRVVVPAGMAAGYSYPETEAVAKAISADQVQLIAAAMNRIAGRTALIDSHQEKSRKALVGDSFRVELHRVSMDARVFANLHQRLQARLVAADGAVQSVKLLREGDKFVTDPIPLKQPGTLGIILDLSVQGTQISIRGELEIVDVTPRIDVEHPPVLQSWGRVPEGTLVSLNGGWDSETTDGEPAGSLLNELLARQAHKLVWQTLDSTNAVIDSGTQEVGTEPWSVRLKVQQRGKQTLRLELRGDEQVLHRLEWQYQSVDPVMQLAAHAKSTGDELPSQTNPLARRLPSWLVRPVPCEVVASVASSPAADSHFLASVRSGATEGVFDEQRGVFVLPPANDHRYVGVLQPLVRGRGPEIQLAQQYTFNQPLEILIGRLIAVVAGSFACCVVLRWLQIWIRHNPQNRIAVISPQGDAVSLPVGAPRGFFGLRESLILPGDIPRDPDASELPADTRDGSNPAPADTSSGKQVRKQIRIYRPWFQREVYAKVLVDGISELPKGTRVAVGTIGEANVDYPDLQLPDATTINFEFLEDPVADPA